LIQASIDEVSGKREEALQTYRSLEKEIKDPNLRISQRARDGVRRLSR
jgi:hypothetical protein